VKDPFRRQLEELGLLPGHVVYGDRAVREQVDRRCRAAGFRGAYDARDRLRARYAYAVPDAAALAALAALSPLVEIGAGLGYWASLLAARGADIIAYDKQPPGKNDWFDAEAKPYFAVRQGDAAAAAAHPERTLFVCWPPYSEGPAPTRPDVAAAALAAYRGTRLAYIGEGRYGCTAGQRFFDALERDWQLVQTIGLPNLPGVSDALFIYRRRSAARPR
jgi:hypothetical protein